MKKNNKKYALKEMSKVRIIDRHSERSIKGERDFLSVLLHPFIVNMVCSFQVYDFIFSNGFINRRRFAISFM